MFSWIFNTLSATPPFPSIYGPEGFLPWLFYTIMCIVADVIHDIRGPVIRPPSAPSSSVDDMKDEDLLKICNPLLGIYHINSHVDLAKYRLPMLNHDTVYKWIQPSKYRQDTEEANAQILVSEQTTIPVPQIRRIVNRPQGSHFLVMDYIKGRTLADVWGSMSFWRKMKVAWILRGYVRQLRRLKAPPEAPPGPISSYGPSTYKIPAFGERSRGPFTSYADLSDFFQKRAQMSLPAYPNLPANDPLRISKFDDSEPLVLSHLDINPRNIIVGEDNRLWLVDFGRAGYYPPWFEYVSTLYQCVHEHGLEYDMKDWKVFVPFICGPYFEQEVWRRRIGIGLMYL